MFQNAFTMSRGRRPDTVEVEIEFRLFAIDRVLPLVSTSVSGRSSRVLKPHVRSRIVDPDGGIVPASGNEAPARGSPATTAFMAAIEREVRVVRRALQPALPGEPREESVFWTQ
jgi:hypothetical protein